MSTVTVKTVGLQGPALDWAVAKAIGRLTELFVAPNEQRGTTEWARSNRRWYPSTTWSQGGPLIEQHDISFRKYHRPGSPAHGTYYAKVCRDNGSIIQWSNKRDSTGPTPLIAAMRCLVAAKLGDTVQVPQELCQ